MKRKALALIACAALLLPASIGSVHVVQHASHANIDWD